MPILTRPYHAEQDRRAVLDLLTRARAAARYDRYPTTHRLDLLLTSRLWEPERDARVWLDTDGRMVGFAMLWRRSLEHRNVTLEAFADPDTHPPDFDTRALRWACTRSAELARELSHVASLVVVVGADEHARIAFLRRHAFVLLEGYPVRMGRTLPPDSLHSMLPQGFTLRRLGAEADLTRYAALYDQVFSSAVSAAHRCELLLDPDYAHFVIAAPDGNLVAFCECSISRAEWALGGARIGEIDYLGTLEHFQHRGLGTALLDAAFRQLREWGAEEVSLVTGGTNDQAQRVYRHAGMEIVDHSRVYALEIAP